MTSQTRAFALQLAWFVREYAKHSPAGVCPQTLASAERLIEKGGFAPSNSVTEILLATALQQWDQIDDGPSLADELHSCGVSDSDDL